MFPFLRFSAVTATIIVASTAFGFGLAATILSAKEVGQADISNGPRVVSPGSQTRENTETRSVSGLKTVVLASRSISMIAYPASNPEGPRPSLAHANLGASRSIVSACLMAAN
jgi:hypothetical protein